MADTSLTQDAMAVKRGQYPAEIALTVRDHFAGQVLMGLCDGEMWPGDKDADEMARRAYVFADAMLKARAK